MEFVNSYWYIIIPGLVAVIFLFGYRAKNADDNIPDEKEHGTDACGKASKCHGCCH